MTLQFLDYLIQIMEELHSNDTYSLKNIFQWRSLSMLWLGLGAELLFWATIRAILGFSISFAAQLESITDGRYNAVCSIWAACVLTLIFCTQSTTSRREAVRQRFHCCSAYRTTRGCFWPQSNTTERTPKIVLNLMAEQFNPFLTWLQTVDGEIRSPDWTFWEFG